MSLPKRSGLVTRQQTKLLEKLEGSFSENDGEEIIEGDLLLPEWIRKTEGGEEEELPM